MSFMGGNFTSKIGAGGGMAEDLNVFDVHGKLGDGGADGAGGGAAGGGERATRVLGIMLADLGQAIAVDSSQHISEGDR
jgi:hypothetical protein